MLSRDREAIEGGEARRLAPGIRIELCAHASGNFAARPSVGSIPLRNSRLPVCTASAYVPNGSGGTGRLMPNACNLCSGTSIVRLLFAWIPLSYRSDRNATRSSSLKSWGCSQAAK